MGLTTKWIPFFTEDITIIPDETTDAQYFGRPVSIGEFAQGARCTLEEIQETGELIARLPDGRFIRGRQIGRSRN